MAQKFAITVSGSATDLFPMDTVYGLLWYGENDALAIPKKYPYIGEWGEPLSDCLILEEATPMPDKLDLFWLSVVEGKYYRVSEDLPVKALENVWKCSSLDQEPLFSKLVVGMAPYGEVVLWAYGEKKSIVLGCVYGVEIPEEYVAGLEAQMGESVEDRCKFYLKQCKRALINLRQNGLPAKDRFKIMMSQFNYRYIVLSRTWDEENDRWLSDSGNDEFELLWIEDCLWDGTHDKTHSCDLMKNHNAGKPKRINLKWHIGKSEYSAYFWMDEEAVTAIFERFYGAHPETKADFIIGIDAANKKYELSLFRQGLKEPVAVPESAYQMIVFKNKFEDYRSDNYDRPRGAWIW